ncbi:MAG: hypothetical protein OXG95_01195 [Chloroflexi bacterium]|nr:hypothetical protein [Chloroflexota bacterium]
MRWFVIALAVACIGCDPEVAETPAPSAVATLTASPTPQTVVVGHGGREEPRIWEYGSDRATILSISVHDMFVVECAGGEIEAHVAIGNGLRPLPGPSQDSHEITWSVNDGSTVSEVWRRSEDGMTLHVSDRAMPEILHVEDDPLIYTAVTIVRIDAAGGDEPTRPLPFDLPALDREALSCLQ